MLTRRRLLAHGFALAGGAVVAGKPDRMSGAAPAPPLRVAPDGRWFAAGNARFDYREISAFSLYSRWLKGQHEHVRAWAGRAASHRVTVLRVILTLGGPYWEQQPQGWFRHDLASGPHVAGFYEELGEFIDAMAALGLRVRLVLLGDLHMFVPPARYPDLVARRDVLDDAARVRIREYVKRTVTTVAARPTILWEVANEYVHIGLADSATLVTELGAMVKQHDPDALMNFSAPRDHTHDDLEWVKRPADFVSVHVSRDRDAWGHAWLGELAQSPAVARDRQPVRMPFLSGEPLNFGDARRDGRQDDVEPSTSVAFAYGAASRVLQVNATFHHDDGLWTAGWGDRTEATIAAWRRGMDVIPMAVADVVEPGSPSSPWEAGARAASSGAVREHVEAGRGPVALLTGGRHSVAIGSKSGWQHDAAVKAGRRVDVVARANHSGIESVVFVETT